MQEKNDRDFLQATADLNEDAVCYKAQMNRSACGAQTVACAIKTAKILGSKKGTIIHQSSSYDPNEIEADGMVGYGSVVF